MTIDGKQVVYASIGLNLRLPAVADTSFHYGGDISFAQAIIEEVNATKAWERWGHLTRSKVTAPHAIWSIFASRTQGKFSENVIARTALAFDLDEGNVSADSLRAALLDLGWESAFYTTWSAKEDALRWRIIVPLATPHGLEGWDEFYSVKLTEFQTALEAHHGSCVPLDLSARLPAQPQILPHSIPSMFLPGMTEKKLAQVIDAIHSDAEYGPPGFDAAQVFGTRGNALSHSSSFVLVAGARRTISPATFAQREKAGAKGSRAGKALSVEVTAYCGNCASSAAKKVVDGWIEKGLDFVPSLCAGQDGAAYLAEHGIRVSKGHRRDVLVAAAWNLHRAGFTVDEIERQVDCMVQGSNKADQTYLNKEAAKYLKQLRALENEALSTERAVFEALGRGKVEDQTISKEVKRQFSRILSRAKHLRRPQGGQLSQEQIADCLGFTGKDKDRFGIRLVRFFLGQCERAGLLTISGECLKRVYHLVNPQ
jgi:hypothetical protein